MMRFGTTIFLAGMSLAMPAMAVVTEGQVSPYQSIAAHNVFRLSPPKPVVVEPAIRPISLPKISLTGITTILGRRMAFLTLPPAKPGDAPNSFALAEGQSVNDIEVKSIDERAGVVSIANHGEPQILDFQNNGAETSGPRNQPEPHLPPPLSPPSVSARNETPLTPEEQVALIEIQRVKYQQENNPIHQILPATEMTSETPPN